MRIQKLAPPFHRKAIAVTAVAASAVLAVMTGGAGGPEATATPSAPATVPAPTSTTSVVTVKVGGDRTAISTVGPLAGVGLSLFATAGSATPIAQPWAVCTSDADGDCNFVVPETQVGGVNRNARYFVRETTPAAGWFSNLTLRTGPGDGTGSQADVYQFQTPALLGNNTYSSTNQFMISTNPMRTASGGVWQQSRANPPSNTMCGLDVALVLDISNSVGGSLPQLKQAADTFVDALVGTPSRAAVFSFSTNSPSGSTTNHPTLEPVSTTAGADSVKALYAGWNVSGGTNWDTALWQLAAAPPVYELAVIITDGNPTFFSNPALGNGSDTRFREVENGIFSANVVKSQGTRVLAFGVGSGVTGLSGLNLRALSGPVAYNGTNGQTADYFQTSDYAAAGQDLRALALGRCFQSLAVIKQIVPAGTTGEDVTGATPAGAGWEFAGSTTTAGIGGLPATVSTTNSGTGAVAFDLAFPGGTQTASVEVDETQQTGFELVTQGGHNAVCTDLGTGQPVTVIDDNSDPAHPGFTVDVQREAAISCTVYNRPIAADVTVAKQWVVDGTSYAHGSQPAGNDAALTLTGPAGAAATPQPWGTARPGYTVGDTATVDETTTVAPGCTLSSARVMLANGTVVDAALPFDATLDLASNTYTVTNSVTCPPPPTTTSTSTSTTSTSTTSTVPPTTSTSTTVPPSSTTTSSTPVSTSTTVTPPPAPPTKPTSNLPKTGAALGILFAVGLALLSVGGPAALWSKLLRSRR